MIVDAHTDVLLELVIREGEQPPFELLLRRGEAGVFKRYWLPRLTAADVGVQICPLYGEGARRPDARARTLAQEAEFRRVVEDNAEHVCQVQTRAELDDPRLRLVLSMEGVEPLEGDPGAFEGWYELGVRSASLTWNYANEFAGVRSSAGSTSSESSSTSRTPRSRPGATCSKKRCRSRSRTQGAARCSTI